MRDCTLLKSKEYWSSNREVEGSSMSARDVGKCMGYGWRGDLSAITSIDENTKKARHAFIHFGSIGVFQGDISPLSLRAVLESCVMPVLLSGCEKWIFMETLWQKLEAFQGKVMKHVAEASL